MSDIERIEYCIERLLEIEFMAAGKYDQEINEAINILENIILDIDPSHFDHEGEQGL